MAGELFIVGIGQKTGHLTADAVSAIKKADVIAGHEVFVRQVAGFIPKKAKIISDKKLRGKARDVFVLMSLRANALAKEVSAGKKACILSGGDAGIFGVAAYCLEKTIPMGLKATIVPGIPAFLSAAATAGAPISEGFALLPLCDEYIPERIVFKRIKLAAMADLPIVIYKPKFEANGLPKMYPKKEYPALYPIGETGEKRIKKLARMLLRCKKNSTPVAIINDICSQSAYYREKSTKKVFGHSSFCEIIQLKELEKKTKEISFFSTLIIGNNSTIAIGKRIIDREWRHHKKTAKGAFT